ncbi:head maturation protease, ClpP-related [Mycobacterium paraintracellulare]
MKPQSFSGVAPPTFATSYAAIGCPPGGPATAGSFRRAPLSSSLSARPLAAPDAERQWFKWASAQAAGNRPKGTTLHIYDVIGADVFFGGVDVNALVSEIEDLEADVELEVRINSPGGAAWDGLALANAIMRHPGRTTTYIDGLAASAASVVALAGDEVVISKYGQMMLHNARFSLFGASVEDLVEAAQVGAKLNASMADYYADRAGGTATEWAGVMAQETWYSADEAKSAGLAHRVDTSGKRDPAAAASIAKAAAMLGRTPSDLDGRRRAVAVARARRARRTFTTTTGVTS